MKPTESLKPFAVVCGDVFACLKHVSHEGAAQYALIKAFATGNPIGLSDEVEVVMCGDDEIQTFDPEELMKAAGGIHKPHERN